jgi:hypothetical protein
MINNGNRYLYPKNLTFHFLGASFKIFPESLPANYYFLLSKE